LKLIVTVGCLLALSACASTVPRAPDELASSVSATEAAVVEANDAAWLARRYAGLHDWDRAQAEVDIATWALLDAQRARDSIRRAHQAALAQASPTRPQLGELESDRTKGDPLSDQRPDCPDFQPGPAESGTDEGAARTRIALQTASCNVARVERTVDTLRRLELRR
jgi:hypothetical protein